MWLLSFWSKSHKPMVILRWIFHNSLWRAISCLRVRSFFLWGVAPSLITWYLKNATFLSEYSSEHRIDLSSVTFKLFKSHKLIVILRWDFHNIAIKRNYGWIQCELFVALDNVQVDLSMILMLVYSLSPFPKNIVHWTTNCNNYTYMIY